MPAEGRSDGDDTSSRWRSALARKEASPARCAALAAALLRGRQGLEVGGPSRIFGPDGKLPVYPHAARIDNVVFAERTLWHDTGASGSYRFDPDRPPGRQWVSEGATLPAMQPGSIDFVLASHVLEHMANPLGALCRWREVLVGDGVLLLVVPHRDGSFDRRRPLTPLSHLLADHEAAMGEDDMTHVAEALVLHDYGWGEGTDRASFEAALMDNWRRRSLHHHVFDTELVGRVVDWAGFELLALEPAPLFHIIALARADSGQASNAEQLGATASWRRWSPFPSDRQPAVDGPEL